jgi:heme/copper-type cytochrome/quinol oxidase subunit 3
MLALPPAPAPAPRRQVLTGTVVAGAAAAMLMGGMLAIWFRFRAAAPLIEGSEGQIAGWIPKNVKVPMVPVNTMLFTMVMACLMGQYAVYSAKRGDRSNTGIGLGIALLMGVAVVNVQAVIYAQMKVGIRKGTYEAMFYAVTGTFIVFVIIGIVLTALTIFRYLGGRSADRELVSASALVWYILTGIFIALWFVVYVTK